MKAHDPKGRFGYVDPQRTALFVCDIQEKFEKSIELFDMVVSNVERMVKASNILEIPIVITEQYPKVSIYKITLMIVISLIVLACKE